MQPLGLIKSIEVEDVNQQQTLLILPAAFLKQFSPKHLVSFREVTVFELLLNMVGPGQVAYDATYKLVTSKGSSWVSVPRDWLRNIGASKGDWIDLFATVDPNHLLLKYRRKPVAQSA